MIHKIIWTDNASTLQKNMNRQHAGIQGKGGHIQEKVLFYVFLHQFEFSKGGGGGVRTPIPLLDPSMHKPLKIIRLSIYSLCLYTTGT